MVDVEMYRRKMSTDPDVPMYYRRVLIDTNVEPKTDASYDLGSSLKRFRDLHLSRNGNIPNVNSDKVTIVPPSSGADALVVRDVGNTVDRFKVLEDGTVRLYGNIDPDTWDARTVGVSGRRLLDVWTKHVQDCEEVLGRPGLSLRLGYNSAQVSIRTSKLVRDETVATCDIGSPDLPFTEGYFTGLVSIRRDSGDYGGGFVNYTPPTGREGALLVVEDTNAVTPGRRLYVYSGGAWRYVDLT